MSRSLVIKPSAEADLAQAKAWYDGCRPGLGEEFLDSVGTAFESVRKTPGIYPEVHRGLRLALIRRFPYAVVYRVSEDQITVVAVYHTRRNPRGWQGRA